MNEISIETSEHLRSGAGVRWAGYVLSVLVTLALVVDGLVNILKPSITSAQMAATGFLLEQSSAIGAIVLVCAILYAIPQTSVLGAICITGFLGGAICTHFRVSGLGSAPQIVSAIIGIVAWLGLYLRIHSLRSCVPFVRPGGRQPSIPRS